MTGASTPVAGHVQPRGMNRTGRPGVDRAACETLNVTASVPHTPDLSPSGSGCRPARCGRGVPVRGGMEHVGAVVPGVLEQMTKRIIVETVINCIPSFWRRRARVFDDIAAAYLKQHDRDGYRRNAQTATNCRRHAWLLETYGPGEDVVAELYDQLDAILNESPAA